MEELIEKGLELVAEAAIPALVGIGTAIAGLFVGVVVYKLVVKQLSKSNLISVVFRALEPLFCGFCAGTSSFLCHFPFRRTAVLL